MSIFKDTSNVYGTNPWWNSSDWKPYYHKSVYRDVTSSEDGVSLRFWCNEPDWIGKELYVEAAHSISAVNGDLITKVAYPGESGVNSEADDYAIGAQDSGYSDSSIAHTDRTLKHWFAPGVAFQLPDGISNTTAITQTNKWPYTPTESDVGEKVYDGGIHCWVKFPYDTVASGSADGEKYVATKPVPMEYIGNSDNLFIFNTFGQQIRREKNSTAANTALQIQKQISFKDDPPEGIDLLLTYWKNSDNLIADEGVDIEDNTGDGATGLNDKFMFRTMLGELEGTKNLRFMLSIPDGSYTEARMLRSQFVRISIYPIDKI